MMTTKKKEIQCECGAMVAACGMKNHLRGGDHDSRMTRESALREKGAGYEILRICERDKKAMVEMGYETVEDAFFHPGSKNRPGYYTPGVIVPEGEHLPEVAQCQHTKKIQQMREYRKNNRQELLLRKKEAYPIYRLQRLAKKAIAKMGKMAENQKLWTYTPLLVAQAEKGLIIRSENRINARRVREEIVEVVVRDTTTGHVHFLRVPPEFGDVDIEQCPVTGDMSERAVRAAIAWTFNMKPEDYAPEIEA
jgi:hypothetical protein